MSWHKLIASLSALCSTSFSLHLLELNQTLWKLASSYEVYLNLWIIGNPFIYLIVTLHYHLGVNETCLTITNTLLCEYL